MADSESVEIKAPEFPESVADGEVATWHVQVGEAVRRDQVIVDIETDKVVLEVVAPADGKLVAIVKEEGETVLADELLATFETGDVGAAAPSPTTRAPDSETPTSDASDSDDVIASPAARKMAEEQGLTLSQVAGSGKDGRITKEDVLKAVADAQKPSTSSTPAPQKAPETNEVSGERLERRVPMTRIRASIARRLVEAQQTAAMLTTFNEVDMSPIMELRSRYKEEFEKAHNGTRLGFMSFFVRSSIEALKRFPLVNASIDGNDIVYHGYQDIGVAVGSPRGLVVPVLRDADSLTLAEIEDQIRDFGSRAQENKLSIADMTGGTFTISNGGVFGSLLSTPILNPPQTAILGMHKIADRPVAVNGEVVIRPMMYLALSYDHRLIDGQEAVRFLVKIKDFLEEPARILLDL
ncbi:MAG: dihydrolipoyllysine-residue succinyltransferase [Gammaproteobacteria bacterium]|uniref:Dihydrolipoyllysine-residue succinyltransferase component of 2-oxoglutarate dehydrogenase complex n=1 Tax=OM182 bacterium MED-G24 TaxID=1986255 RepID=A0A2A5WJV2_9GAMM|nr:dihydrolipoyllysine-residue succinyltransferase [Gammaproteobacteria bacterium]PDH36702.1 MAG: dihydrolipoyllysine-residue succinyltransferase [OM182 bacterium MED-G24]RPG25116.1 MAG: 2-oxoglutarate dehydrogenase complex dihydrolipoyllysine-residue succinyltransferase [Gammaproteobacteria bacterium TMED50]